MFNLFNILTVLVVISALAAALYFFVLRYEEKEDTVSTAQIEYVIEIGRIREELLDKISIGDTVIDSAKNTPIGTVSGVEYTPSYSYVLDETTGQIVRVEYPDHSDIIVTVRAEGYKTGVGYDINSSVINVGRTVYARFPAFANNGYCISVRTLDK